MKLLVTGGAGFIGSNFIIHILKSQPNCQVVNLDKLTYAGNLENLKYIETNPGYRFIKGDIADSILVHNLLAEGFDAIVNFAAESHVDRSIEDPFPFIESNVKGTQVLLEGARRYQVDRFVQISTDEVYGSLDTKGRSREESPLLPSSPYAASKAAADLLCMAYYRTYKSPVIITRCGNNYGPRQFPEKLIPLIITNVLEGKPVPIYGDGLNKRDWIYVTDHCRAIETVVSKGEPGHIYNIGTSSETTNLEVVNYILDIMKKPRSLINFVKDRPGHDRRYALNTTKIKKAFDWQPVTPLLEGLKKTVNWYLSEKDWWQRVKEGEYAQYYERMYSQR